MQNGQNRSLQRVDSLGCSKLPIWLSVDYRRFFSLEKSKSSHVSDHGIAGAGRYK